MTILLMSSNDSPDGRYWIAARRNKSSCPLLRRLCQRFLLTSCLCALAHQRANTTANHDKAADRISLLICQASLGTHVQRSLVRPPANETIGIATRRLRRRGRCCTHQAQSKREQRRPKREKLRLKRGRYSSCARVGIEVVAGHCLRLPLLGRSHLPRCPGTRR